MNSKKQESLSSNPQFLLKPNQTSIQNPDVSLHSTNSKTKKNDQGTLTTKLLGDARSHFLSIRINLC